MRILHLLDHSLPLHSGYAFRTLAIVRHQRKQGWETYHLTSNKQGTNKRLIEQVEGLTFFRSRPLPGWVTKVPLLNQFAIAWRSYQRVIELSKQLEFDVIHAHSPALNGLAAIWARSKLGKPVVYEVRAFWEDAAVDHGTAREWGVRYRLTRALESWVLKKADAVTTICNGLRQEIIARNIAPQKITVIPNAVDLQQFPHNQSHNNQLRERLGLRPGPVLGFVGSFYAYEGLELLLQAFANIVKDRPYTCLLLVGGGPQETALKRQAEQLQISKHVVFTGRIPHDEINQYYSLIDVLVFPRIAMRLTELVTPLKPLEAMAQHKLVVASDVGGHKELIRDGENGVLFESGNVDALTDRLLETLAQPSTWQSYHQAGYQFVAEQRNWPVSVARYKQVYEVAHE